MAGWVLIRLHVLENCAGSHLIRLVLTGLVEPNTKLTSSDERQCEVLQSKWRTQSELYLLLAT